MTINKFEPSQRLSSLLKGFFSRHRSILLYLPKKKKKKKRNWLPYRFSAIMSSSAICLLQNFSPRAYRPPLPYRLLPCNLKPSKSTTGKIYYMLPKSYKLSLLTANIANLVCITLNLKSIIEINTK